MVEVKEAGVANVDMEDVSKGVKEVVVTEVGVDELDVTETAVAKADVKEEGEERRLSPSTPSLTSG